MCKDFLLTKDVYWGFIVFTIYLKTLKGFSCIVFVKVQEDINNNIRGNEKSISAGSGWLDKLLH